MTTYVDLDLSFKPHPVTGDVLKKFDVEAAKQALRRIFFTEKFEKPFDPNFGLGIRGLLFENEDSTIVPILTRKIQEQLLEYEPRVVLDDLSVEFDENTLSLTIQFHVIGVPGSTQQVAYTLERIR